MKVRCRQTGRYGRHFVLLTSSRHFRFALPGCHGGHFVLLRYSRMFAKTQRAHHVSLEAENENDEKIFAAKISHHTSLIARTEKFVESSVQANWEVWWAFCAVKIFSSFSFCASRVSGRALCALQILTNVCEDTTGPPCLPGSAKRKR